MQSTKSCHKGPLQSAKCFCRAHSLGNLVYAHGVMCICACRRMQSTRCKVLGPKGLLHSPKWDAKCFCMGTQSAFAGRPKVGTQSFREANFCVGTRACVHLRLQARAKHKVQTWVPKCFCIAQSGTQSAFAWGPKVLLQGDPKWGHIVFAKRTFV